MVNTYVIIYSFNNEDIMAWGETKVEKQRKLFCLAILNKELSHSEASRQFCISRNKGYVWLDRYKKHGDEGLKDQSRARKTQDHETPSNIINQIIDLKCRYPTWGAKKLHPLLIEKDPTENWPGTTTISKILKKHGLTKSRKLRIRLPVKSSSLTQAEQPNAVWCMDFKGWALTKDNYKFDPFTLMDQNTRYLLRSLKLDSNNTEHVWSVLDIAFREYGLPHYIRSDNGPPFATCAPGRFSKLSVKILKAGVIPEWIEPGNPQQNGRLERMHLTMENEGFDNVLNLKEQSEKLDDFRKYYNYERPHEALGQRTPGSLYVASTRTWNGRLQTIEYSNDYRTVKVRSCGKASWRGRDIYISGVFAGELLGIKEGENGVEVYFGPFLLGTITKDYQLEVKRREVRKRYKNKFYGVKQIVCLS
jgi:putative transposase